MITRLAYVLTAMLALTTFAPVAQTIPNDAQKIVQVEHGLTTPVIIDGASPQTMTLKSRMQYYHIPSVSIAFFDASGLRWTRAYGATTETLFQAASISKAVSAVGIMRLVQSGRLRLDENVNDGLSGWKLPQAPIAANQPVSLRELLSHTAGTTVSGFAGYERGKPIPTLDQILVGSPPANSAPIRVAEPPGVRYDYSGGGYVVAQKLALDAVHEPFAVYMQRSVLGPLGMTNSTFEQPLPRRLWSRAAVATDSHGVPYPGNWNVYPEQTAAGLWTTPTDLAKFAIGIQHALDGDANAILSPATAREMLTPVKDHYGLGFETSGPAQPGTFGHNGANAGFQAKFVMHRGGEGVAIMTDSDNGIRLIGELLSSISAAYGWTEYRPVRKILYPMPPAAYSRFVGNYDFGFGVWQIVQRDTAIYVVNQSGEQRLYPESPSTFFELDQPVALAFSNDASGAITALSFVPNGSKGTRIAQFPTVVGLDSTTLSGYAGTYSTGRAAMVVTIAAGRPFAKLGDQQPIEIFPSAKDQFFFKAVNARISFTRNDVGNVTMLTLHQNGKDTVFSK